MQFLPDPTRISARNFADLIAAEAKNKKEEEKEEEDDKVDEKPPKTERSKRVIRISRLKANGQSRYLDVGQPREFLAWKLKRGRRTDRRSKKLGRQGFHLTRVLGNVPKSPNIRPGKNDTLR